MKKLMFALVAMTAVLAANAAETKWKFGQASGVLYDGYNSGATGWEKSAVAEAQVYAICADFTSQTTLVNDWQSSIKNKTTFDLSSYAVKGSAASGGNELAVGWETDANGQFKAGTTVFNAADFEVTTPTPTSYNFYLATLIDSDNNGVADYIFVSQSVSKGSAKSTSTITATVTPATSSLNLGTWSEDAAWKASTSGSWYKAAAVPEPTSGLLLLLGVAGLALKRKRA